jgi:anti-sigma regulatory factor (Ser/Thr protein kinase)
MQTGFSVRLHNRLLDLDRLAEAVEAFGEAHELSPKLTYQVGLVLDELVTNIISYGYGDEDEHGIDIGMSREAGFLRFVLIDDAAPFDPLLAKAPNLDAEVAQRHIGGLGVHLVRTIMDRVAYERVGNSNRLVLEKDTE